MTSPAPIIPSPATTFTSLRGRRAIVGVPGVGFRADLRCDDPVVRAGRTFVPILTEQDYYRAEAAQIEVFAPLVPIDRVWVELPGTRPTAPMADLAALDAPLVRVPQRLRLTDHVCGRRLVEAVPDGFVRDLRAVSDVYTGVDGTDHVRVCDESAWYLWASEGAVPTTTEISTNRLWIE